MLTASGKLSIRIIGNGNLIKLEKGIELINSSELLLVGDGINITIGKDCRLSHVEISCHAQSSVKIGDKTTVGSGTTMKTHANSAIIIGKDCMFSWNVRLQTGDGHSIFDSSTGERINRYDRNTIELGEHVWIGRDAMILSGRRTFVNRGSIIGANSCVKGNYMINNVAIAGNPGRVIRENIAWSRNPDAESIEQCNGYSELSQPE